VTAVCLKGRRRCTFIELAPLGLRVDKSSSWVDARLSDGSRVRTRFLRTPFLVTARARATQRIARGGDRPYSTSTRRVPSGDDPDDWRLFAVCLGTETYPAPPRAGSYHDAIVV
jgi:hypothetical protein